jgi:uncharacterized protein (DUF3820 family)
MTDDARNVVPFGKYKGRLIEEVLADDPGYARRRRHGPGRKNGSA